MKSPEIETAAEETSKMKLKQEILKKNRISKRRK
jgi:hypothetical protein